MSDHDPTSTPGPLAKLWLRDSVAAYVGPLSDNTPHSHFTLQLCFAARGDIRLELGGQQFSVPGVLIGSQVPHRLLTTTAPVFVVLAEPTPHSRLFLNERPFMVLSRVTVEGLVHRYHDDPRSLATSLASLWKDLPPRSLDSRVARVMEHVSAEENCQHCLRELAPVAGLSESRLTHLFRSQLGVSLKHYCLWKRTLFAVDSMRSGRDLTSVALSCGFSDSAHLSRTFRKMFGLSMRSVFQNDRSVQVLFVDDQ